MTQPTENPDNGRRAAEQAKAYKSLFDPQPLKLNNGDTIKIPPPPSWRLLDDDTLEAYDELMFETESYDRAPDIFIPEQTIKDTAGNEIKLAAETKKGPLLEPYRKTGADGVARLIKPPHTVRVVQVVLGEDTYAKLRAGGKSAADVWRIWNQMGLDIADRQRDDSKSDGGDGVLEGVSPPDSE